MGKCPQSYTDLFKGLIVLTNQINHPDKQSCSLEKFHLKFISFELIIQQLFVCTTDL